MKQFIKQSSGFLATMAMVAALAIWLWVHLSDTSVQRSASEPVENINLMKLI